MTFTVAILGRPNVGKSTLFNRLVGRKIALVDDQPGVTRDRREGLAQIGDLSFRVFDTAGLDDAKKETLEARMSAQAVDRPFLWNVAGLLSDTVGADREYEITDAVTQLAAKGPFHVVQANYWLPIGDPAQWQAAQTTDLTAVK